MQEKQFEGQVAIVTGAARGFGQRTAQRLGEQGASVVISDYNAPSLEKTIALLEQDNIPYAALGGDIADEATSESLVDLAKSTFGGLDIAVNNAGIAQDQVRLHETDSAVAKRIMDVDLMGVFYAMKHQLPALMERCGATDRQCNIVNIASAAGLMGSPKLAAYAAAKHGVVGLTRSAATEYASRGIRINAVCPAFAKTNMVTDMLEASPKGADAAEAGLVKGIPMRRLGEIDEVVQAILWVCSPANGFYNGQALSIDGGLTTF